jgi:hypothetical protein
MKWCIPLVLASICATLGVPYEAHLSTNAVYDLSFRDGLTSTAYQKYAGTALSLDQCAGLAWAWANASDPGQQCLTAVWLHSPSNATFTNSCYCLTIPKWIPVYPDPAADSARLLRPCQTDFDCSYNGACEAASGACACDAGWVGLRCGELALGAVDRAHPGYRGRDPGTLANVSTWGAPMLQDEGTGLWHAWLSEMTHECGINSWKTNSQIVHATAAAPQGPWDRREVVVAEFAHEPDVVRGPSGEWVMVYSGFPLPNASDHCRANCSQGSTGDSPDYHRGGCGPHYMHPFHQMMATSTSPDGPWESFEIPRLTTGWDWNFAITILPNGSSVGLIRAGMVMVNTGHYANASAWVPWGGVNGGFGPQLLGNGNVEDPALWRDDQGRFHAIFHNMEPTTGQTQYCGTHAFSPDGLVWTSGGWAFGGGINYTDGTPFSFSRRERPHPVVDRNGALLGISSGVQYGGPFGDAIFSLFNPLK